MKTIVCSVLLFLFFHSSFAQVPTDWGAFSQRVDVKSFRGKKFQLQAAVRVELIDSTAEGEIWVRVDRAGGKMGFFYNMMDKPIRSNEWKVYSISGKIDKDAEWLAFGGLYHRKGKFYFDDFKLMIESADGKLEEVPVKEGSFEGDTTSIYNSWGYLQKRNGFIAQTMNTAYAGNKSFMVDGEKFKAIKTYGNNEDSGNYVNVNNIRLYYETYGSGEPLLLLHGNSMSISSFNKQIPELSRHFKVIAIDTRGQGRSTEDGTKFTYDLFAEDTKALLDALHLDSVNVLGWSDGGNIGLIMAMRYPSKVRRLAIMGANLYNNASSVKPWVNKLLKKELQSLSDTTRNDIFRKRMINLLLFEPNIDATQLAKINCPVLVMAGSNDVIKEEHTKLIANGIRQSQLLIFPKGNHEEPSERPERFNKAVLEFLGKK